MSKEFTAYMFIVVASVTVAICLAGWRRCTNLANCVGWYFVVFGLSYIVEPFGSKLAGVNFFYQYLRMGPFEDHWYLMATAVPLAILSFGIAYRLTGRAQRTGDTAEQIDSAQIIEGRNAYHFAVALIVLGYIAAVITMATGTGDVSENGLAGSSARTYQHGTAWIAQADLFVSTGATLYYILTDRIGMTLAVASPWLAGRLIKGWGRIKIVVFFFSLMAAHFVKAERSGKRRKAALSHRLLFVAVILLLAILFPVLAAIRTMKDQLNISRGALAPELWEMVWKNTNLLALGATWFSANTSITGFETTLYSLIADSKPALGLHYFYLYFIVPIPRVLWPGKGAMFTWPQQLLGIEPDPRILMAGLAPGSIGWAFQEWGWVGIPAEFALTGWVLRKGEELARRRPDAAFIQLAYVGLYAMVPQLGRTSLLAMLPQHYLFPFGIPVFFLSLTYLSRKVRIRSRTKPIMLKSLSVAGADQIN